MIAFTKSHIKICLSHEATVIQWITSWHKFKKYIRFFVCSWDHEHFGSHESKWSLFSWTDEEVSLTSHETRSVHDLMNRWKRFTYFAWDPKCSWSHEQKKIDFIAYIYILYCLSTVNFQFSYYLAGFLNSLNNTRHNGGLETAKTLNSHV